MSAHEIQYETDLQPTLSLSLPAARAWYTATARSSTSRTALKRKARGPAGCSKGANVALPLFKRSKSCSTQRQRTDHRFLVQKRCIWRSTWFPLYLYIILAFSSISAPNRQCGPLLALGHVALTIDDGLCRSGPERSLIPEVRKLLQDRCFFGGSKKPGKFELRNWDRCYSILGISSRKKQCTMLVT